MSSAAQAELELCAQADKPVRTKESWVGIQGHGHLWHHLTRRQSIVLRAYLDGGSVASAAELLELDPGTISKHKSAAMRNLGIPKGNDVELFRYCVRAGWLKV